MTDVIHLAAGEDPPPDNGGLIVARDLTGGFYVVSAETGYQRTPLDMPISDADRSAAIDRAKAYAEREHMAKVYVVT